LISMAIAGGVWWKSKNNDQETLAV